MSVTAKLTNYRQSPRKVRLVANLLKGKAVEDALVEVKMLEKRSAPVIEKLIRSAVANAKSQGLDIAALVVKELRVDKGLVMRRYMPRAMGRAFPINKRSSHILVTLAEKEDAKKALPQKKDAKAETPDVPAKEEENKQAMKKRTAKKSTK
jgi:large subunit ribosomal protein L22